MPGPRFICIMPKKKRENWMTKKVHFLRRGSTCSVVEGSVGVVEGLLVESDRP